MDFVRYIKKRGHRDPSSRAGSTTYRARLKPKKIDDISLDAIEQGNQQDNQMGGGLVGTKEERDEAERERLASPRSAVNSSSGVAAANFAEMLDSPLRVILEITPEKWITYDGEKAGRHFAGTIDGDELGPMLSSDSDRMEKYRTKRAEEGLTH